MRVVLAELAPTPGDRAANVERVREVVTAGPSDLAVFPELFLSGYRVGDRIHALALRETDATTAALRAIARESRSTVVVGAPLASTRRAGEVHNAVLAVRPDGEIYTQVKRYLPTFGPFEEGAHFTATDESEPMPLAAHSVGTEICYDLFFPEVSRGLALAGSELLVVLSASPVTSHLLFQRLLPARAIENGFPVVFVNRVGVEDGFVFSGGSGVWDPRGEPLPLAEVEGVHRGRDERIVSAEVDLADVGRWRPFRPVLRDVAARPGAPASGGP